MPNTVALPVAGPCARRRALSSFIARRMRWNMNHAVFCVTPSARPSSCEDVPFFVFASSHMAGSHLVNGIGECSKTLAVLAEKFRLQSLQRHRRRVLMNWTDADPQP